MDGLASSDGVIALVHDALPAPIGASGGLAAGSLRSAPGAGLAMTSVFCVQIGAAASTSLFAAVGPAGATWLRLSWAAVIFIVITGLRPRAIARRDLVDAVLLGVVSAGMTLLFFEAIARIPLATAVGCELIGPLAVAVARRSGRLGLAWPALAGAGVLLVTQPWRSSADLVGIGYALGAAICWAGYILLTQRVGDRLTGLTGLAISMPVAALVAGAVAAPQALPRVTAGAVVAAAGLALLLPVVPYALELVALRRLESAAFGTLMSAEPAVALLVGIVVLGQVPQPIQALGVLLVAAAAGGAARTGRRSSPAPIIPATQAPNQRGIMINGTHVIVYTRDAAADCAFIRDTLGFPSVDAGDGWLIFRLPPAEIAVHPTDGESKHELYLMCEDIASTLQELAAKGVEPTRPISNKGWGLLTSVSLPSGSDLVLYQPRHPVAHHLDG